MVAKQKVKKKEVIQRNLEGIRRKRKKDEYVDQGEMRGSGRKKGKGSIYAGRGTDWSYKQEEEEEEGKEEEKVEEEEEK